MKSSEKKLIDLIKKAKKGGGLKKISTQHLKGKLTARERIEVLLDDGSFSEIGMFVKGKPGQVGKKIDTILSDGVVTGFGTINGYEVLVFSQDFTVHGGSLGEEHANKICNILDLGIKNGLPVIGLNDSGGARIQEGVASLGGYAEVFQRNVLASGVIPQISAILGPCAGGAVYSPAMTDFIFMTENTSYMFVTGPEVVKTVTHENVNAETLGGASTHTKISGVADFSFENEIQVLEEIRRLIDFLPQSNKAKQKVKKRKNFYVEDIDSLDLLIPNEKNQPYDIKDLIIKIADDYDFMEIQKNYAKNFSDRRTRLHRKQSYKNAFR